MCEKENSKIDNNSVAIKPLSKNRTWANFIQNEAFMMFPEKDDWRKRFIYTLLAWAEDENNLTIIDFTTAMKMRRPTLYDWIIKYPDIKAAYEDAKLMLSSRYFKGALKRQFDKESVFKTMHKLDPEWLEINKYWSDLKKEEGTQSEIRYVYLEKPKVKSKEEMEAEKNPDIALTVKE